MLEVASVSAVVMPPKTIHHGTSKTALLDALVAGPTHPGGAEDFVRSPVGDDLGREEAQRDRSPVDRTDDLSHYWSEPNRPRRSRDDRSSSEEVR